MSGQKFYFRGWLSRNYQITGVERKKLEYNKKTREMLNKPLIIILESLLSTEQ